GGKTFLLNLLKQRGVRRQGGYELLSNLHAKLVEQHPSMPQYRQDSGKSLANLGLLLQTTYKLQEADTVLRGSLDVHHCVSRWPDAVPFRPLGGGRGRPEAALAWYDQAIATFQRVCAKKPTDALARGWLISARRVRAEALIRLGRLQEAGC